MENKVVRHTSHCVLNIKTFSDNTYGHEISKFSKYKLFVTIWDILISINRHILYTLYDPGTGDTIVNTTTALRHLTTETRQV